MEDGPTDNVGPTVDEVTNDVARDNDGVGSTEVEVENETFGPTVGEVETEKGGKYAGGSRPTVGEEVIGPYVGENEFRPIVGEEESGTDVGENAFGSTVSEKEDELGDIRVSNNSVGEKNVKGCDKEVPGVGRKNDKGEEDDVEVEYDICFELNEDSDVESAQYIHFGDSDDEYMLNDNFDFEKGVNGNNGDEGANANNDENNENGEKNVADSILQRQM